MKRAALISLSVIFSVACFSQHEMHQMQGNVDMEKHSEQRTLKRIGPVVEYHLYVDDTVVRYTGRKHKAIAVNGQIPAPTLTFTEGDSAVIYVHNKKKDEISIHWHGVLLPNEQDGVPTLTTQPITAGETHIFRFRIIQNGTLWYHSHSRFQEQSGLYGPLVFYPASEARKMANEEVLQISDWRDERPGSIMRSLKRRSEWYAIQKKSVQSWGEALVKKRFSDKAQMEWWRMPGADVSDVYYQTHLMHGQPQRIFERYRKGDSVRLRVINGSAATYYWLQYSGGKMKVIAADGNDVVSVEVDKILIATAETYDIIIKIPDNKQYEFRATAQDITKSTSAFFGEGLQVKAKDIPKLDYMQLTGEMNRMTWMMKGMGMKMRMGLYMKMPGMDMSNMGGVPMPGSDNRRDISQMSNMNGMQMQSNSMNMHTNTSGEKSSMEMNNMNMSAAAHNNMLGMPGMDMHKPAAGNQRRNDVQGMDTNMGGKTNTTNKKTASKKPAQKKAAAKKSMNMKGMEMKGMDDMPGMNMSPEKYVTKKPAEKKMNMPGMMSHDMEGGMGNMTGMDTTTKGMQNMNGMQGMNMNAAPMGGMQGSAQMQRDTSRSRMLMNMMPKMPMTGFDFPPGNGNDVVLSYDMLRTDTATALPSSRRWREINITLSGNMARYVWSINGQTLSEQDQKFLIRKGENVRIVFTNATMMEHPMHLHGHFFRVINKQGGYAPSKHTFNINAMATQVIEFAATEEKDWFLHCHTLYHLVGGMATIVSYEGTVSKVQQAYAAEFRKFKKEHGSQLYPWADLGFHSQGAFGNLFLSGRKIQFNQDWRWNWKKSYELETRFQYYLDKRQFFSVFAGAEFKDNNVLNGKVLPVMERERVATLGLIYTLPFLIDAEARIDHTGKFRFQLRREDIPVTTRARLDFYWNTEREYGLNLKYIVAKYLSLSGNYDNQYGWGAGLSIVY